MREVLRNRHISGGIVAKAGPLVGSQRGFSLIEMLLAIAILGIIATGFLSALASSSKAQSVDQRLVSAAHLAQSQMEYVMDQDYAASYTPAPLTSEYANYSVAISVTGVDSRDATIQKIRITVSQNGKPVILAQADGCTLASYKVQI